MKKFGKLLAMAVVLFITLTGAAFGAQYKVVRGDTLWNVSEQFGREGQEWRAIKALNPEIFVYRRGALTIALVHPGQVIEIPDGWVLSVPEESASVEAIPPTVSYDFTIPYVPAIQDAEVTPSFNWGMLIGILALLASGLILAVLLPRLAERTNALRKKTEEEPGLIGQTEKAQRDLVRQMGLNVDPMVKDGLSSDPGTAAMAIEAAYPQFKGKIRQVLSGHLQCPNPGGRTRTQVQFKRDDMNYCRVTELLDGVRCHRVEMEDKSYEYFLSHCGNLVAPIADGRFELPKHWQFVPDTSAKPVPMTRAATTPPPVRPAAILVPVPELEPEVLDEFADEATTPELVKMLNRISAAG